jgi:hypothetical protein
MWEGRMAYSIRIVFTGLTLWVPDKDKMYVLLPAHDSGDHHYQYLYYHRALLSGGNPAPPDENKLRGKEVEFVSAGATGGTRVDKGVANILDFAGAVKRTHLTGASNDHLAARLILPPGEMVVLDSGVRWRIENRRPAFMTHKVMWMVKGGDGPLVLNCRNLAGGLPSRFEYMPEDDELEIRIVNVPEPDLPNRPRPVKEVRCGDLAHHFSAYYDLLLENQTQRRFLPRFAGPTGQCIERKGGSVAPVDHGGGHHGEHERARDGEHHGDAASAANPAPEKFIGGSPFTCMMATTEPEP